METRSGVELQQQKDLEKQEPSVPGTPAVPNHEKSVLVSSIGHGFRSSSGCSSSRITQEGSFSGKLNSSLNGLGASGSEGFLSSPEMATPSFASQIHIYNNVFTQSTSSCNIIEGFSQIPGNIQLLSDPSQAINMTGKIVVLPAGFTKVGTPTWLPLGSHPPSERTASMSFCETGSSLAPITPGKDMHESRQYQQYQHSDLGHQVWNTGSKQDTIMLEHAEEVSAEHGPRIAEPPITPDKCERIQDCFPQAVIDLVHKGLMEEAKRQKTHGFLDQTEKLANEISRPGSQPGDDEFHKKTSATSQQLGTEVDGNEIPGINFSSTPGQRKKRKKHRPKVILEGNTSRTPKPATPNPGRKSESQTGKRSYVRKKRSLDSLDTFSDTVKVVHLSSTSTSSGVGKTADPHMGINTKSVRRKLDFECKDQTIDGHQKSIVTNAESHIKEKLLQAQAPNSRTTSSILLQGLQVNVENSPIGIAFDLSRSLNKVLDEYMNLPEDSPLPFGYSKKKELKKNMNRFSENPELAQMLYVGGRIKKKRSVRVRKSSLIATNFSSSQFLPTQHRSPQSCMEALFATTHVKIKTKKRTRKGQAHSLNSMLSTDELQNNILTGNNSQGKSVGPTAVGGDFQEQTLHDTESSSNTGQELPHANGPSRGIVPYLDPIEDIGWRLKQLKVNPEQAHATAESQNALVLYGSRTMVPYEGPFGTVKKQRPRAKVNLDDETNRVWKLLMGQEASCPAEGSDINKEKWWEQERQVFHGRARAFIARMRLVQGDRHFSPWKGSVLDSVVGVFLTQNVSDHLSSSAFLALAAKFPPHAKGNSTKQGAANMNTFDISRLESMQGPKKHHQDPLVTHDEECREGMGNSISSKSLKSGITDQKVDEQDAEGFDIHLRNDLGPQEQEFGPDTPMELIGNIESKENQIQEDVVSSQGSASSPESTPDRLIETNNQLKSRLESSSGKVVVPGSTFSSSEGFALQELGNDGNDRISLAENHCTIQKTNGLYQSEDTCHSTIYSTRFNFHHLQHGTRSETDFPLSPHSHNSSSSLTENMENATVRREKNTCDTQSDACATKINNLKIVDSNCRPSSKTTMKTAAISHQEENRADFHGNNVQQELKASDKIQDLKIHESSSKSSDNGKADEPNFARDGGSSQNGPTTTTTTTTEKLRTRKGKAASEKTQSFDWDSLRRRAYMNGYKKERRFERNDSLDWEAVRCADVREISEAIRERGMNNVLAARIKDFLNRLIRDHGSIDLEWLRDVPPDKAKDYLLSIRGLGLKSVECVRLLTLHHLAFPVDTNVGRICVRLGWVPLQPLPESVQLHLLELYPMMEKIQKYLWPRLCKLDQQTLYELHYQMITFGKVFCTKSKPNCNACPMRGECKHFASAFASARLALPGPEENSGNQIHSQNENVPCSLRIALPGPEENSGNTIHSQNDIVPVMKLMPLPQPEGSSYLMSAYDNNSEPIIEEPRSPEVECTETLESEIEDTFDEDPDAIPLIKLNLEEFAQNIENCIKENNKELQTEDIVKSLVVITSEAASIPMPKLKNVNRLRTEHQVYELPDSHILLKMLDLDEREPDDPCPYLLTIWMPGETAESIESPVTCCNSQDTGELCDNETCFACCSVRESQHQKVRGTVLRMEVLQRGWGEIPCRTATRGSFPLNGTYFQVNEVFADHYSSHNPIDVPRNWIWNLQRRTVYFGTSIPTIFRGLTTEGIQHCFWRGFVCVRGFDRTMRAPRPLCPRLHLAASKMPKGKKTPAKEETKS